MNTSRALPYRLLCYGSLALLTQCSKCKNETPRPQSPTDPLTILPPETQTGAGTVGCLINGKAFIAPYTTATSGEWASNTRLAINGSLYENGEVTSAGRTSSMVLNGKLLSNQTFQLISSATPFPIFTPGKNQFYAFSGSFSGAITCSYGGKFAKNGQVELVKFDGVARIASGRFAFTLYELGGCDTLRITNGRFDVRF